ncbi:MAG: bifunctional 5,10-methylenetetrahydrofolate dehydrogenase/5,10-methenyltetrahydrofolate cyclohydrolase [Acidimicrobiales bacterium]|nr:bifunctional 5,10-methylenetetrahydrofolate dehydrogenase/5,10-methenyltetrahydrofolate cyclohydrolase [Acidimicrobiales bacterium]MYA26287.1 bifunctional 5,10-methylenetetrahydrofolate dehydrogenase/5,10-methenyltetrahydrofolate cyclohydrolase [Acidimicrobiales bacterium]MYD84028.1 bifunctional 5,10-methylenetetrahydrofolate dehydrogenase/5,10-methenyltetrahydrofolate cyclohydrolase [Acidimicrobiales bacterium]MYI10312.1 bifunctional 5,10-methylenetetrahydrofolate dehydrogenase/5,10-methenyl
MTAVLLDGQALAEQIKDDLRIRIAQEGLQPGLGTILVGDDPASHSYVGAKIRDCGEVGISSIHEELPADITQAELDAVIERFNNDPAVHAYIVQLPLPRQLDEEAALLAIDPDKDADGLHPVNLGRLVMGVDGPLPCTPRGIQVMLEHYGVPVEGRHVVVVGRGLTIGRPMALLMALKRPVANAAVTVVHTGVADLGAYTREADIVIAAAGVPGLVTPDMVKPGAAVVGGGITREGRKILSDVDESVGEVAGWVTPRLGGVGPMTRAMLLANTVDAAAAATG